MNFGAFLGSFSAYQARQINYERTVNRYIERIAGESPNATATAVLKPAPGFKMFVEPGLGEGRGIFAQNDRTFAVVADRLIEILPGKTFVERPLTSLPDFATGPTVTPSTPAPALQQPNPPRIQQGGTVGSTTYGYKVTGTNAIGESIASLAGTIATGAAVLDANNFNHISWDEVPNATGYKVYRTIGGTAPPKLIATLTDASIRFVQDTGQAGTTAVPPTVDTSAQAVGATTWGYRVAAIIGLGVTTASAQGTTATGYAALSSANTNKIKWNAIPNAQGYRVWRTQGPGVAAPVLIAELEDGATAEFTDVGAAGELSTPSTGNTTLTQTLANDGSMVTWASSGDAGKQLLIVSVGKAYCFDLRTNVFALVLDGATFCGYLDTYFCVLDASDSTFKISGVLNGFLWNDTDYQQRTAGADKWISMAIQNNEVWLVGTESTEVWTHTGAPEPAFPFSRILSVFLEKGIGAAFSLVKVEQQLFWLQQDKNGGAMVLKTEGAYGAVAVSTRALEQEIRKYPVVADAEGWTYQDLGHTFYVLSFPSAGRTWLYDLATLEWHERGHWDDAATDFTVYRPRAHAFAFSGITGGLHLVIDRETGTVYEMSSEFGDDVDGRPIRRLRRAPHLANNQRDITFHELELVFEAGKAKASGRGSAPRAMLRWADDGGFNWSSEHWRELGGLGNRTQKVRWLQLGSGRRRTFELIETDPTPRDIIEARLELTAGIY